MQKPTILITAAGKNSRFWPLNNQTHKGFLSLAGMPIVVRALKNLKEHGYQKVVIVVSEKDYGENGFSKYLTENNLGLDIKLVLQKEALGMGNAVLSAKEYLSDSFILTSPYYFDMGSKAEELIARKQEFGANCIFTGSKTETPEMYGILDLDPDNPERVLGVVEKPAKGKEPSPFKIDSFYLLDKNFIAELEKTDESEYSLETAFSSYAKKAEITWVNSTKKVKSAKYPWHLFNIFKQIISQQETSVSQDAEVSKTAVIDDSSGPVIIAAGAKVGDFAKIVGPCYIGKNSLVGDYSFVRGSSLEQGAMVGANTEVVRSIIFERSSVHFGYLADSILGSETRVGAGLITANKRLDRKNVKVKIGNSKKEATDNLIDTKKKALGIITGNNVQIGIRVNTMPGILMGENSVILPGLTIAKNIEENESVK